MFPRLINTVFIKTVFPLKRSVFIRTEPELGVLIVTDRSALDALRSLISHSTVALEI